MDVSVRFWGTRGSVPVPGPATVRYGGNTPCVSVHHGPHQVVLDAGTGIRALGAQNGVVGRSGVHVLLSHTHWDHIQGLPFFAPLYRDDVEVHLWGHASRGVRLADVIERLLDESVFPVPLARLTGRLRVTDATEGRQDVPGFEVEAIPLRHPGGALGFRLAPTGGGPVVSYVTDNELAAAPDGEFRTWRKRLVRFLHGSDLLIHDAMYDDRTIGSRAGWGHSSVHEAVDLAGEAGCRRLCLFHFDPECDDAALDGRLDEAQDRARRDGSPVLVTAAREGQTLTL